MAISLCELDAALRPLKNRLLTRFPEVKSSHITEAIATGLGYQSNASLRADAQGFPAWRLEYLRLDIPAFRGRLAAFGYPVLPDLRVSTSASPPSPPESYREMLEMLKQMEVNVARPDYEAIHRLRKRCAEVFARAFQLGSFADRDDRSVVRRWGLGVDHSVCIPGWGETTNSSRKSFVDFPGNNHVWNFVAKLPLTNGKSATYQSALVSLPYKSAKDISSELATAGTMAGRLGWTQSILDDWSWHQPGETHLVLYRPTATHRALLAQWSGSFKRWLLENRTKLRKASSPTRRNVIDDILDCQHLPFDLRSFQDCRERYLKEYARHLYDGNDAAMAKVFERLMQKWLDQAATSEPAVA